MDPIIKKLLMLTLFIILFTGCASLSSPGEDKPLSDEQRQIMLQRFEPFQADLGRPLKREISPVKPLNVITWYGNEEGLEELWAALPPYVQDISVLLLIPGNILIPGRSPAGLVKTAKKCEELEIPFLIQNINGETHKEWNLPLAWIEEVFTPMDFFYGLSSAELYNGEEWRGELGGDNAQYLTEMIRFCGSYGLFFVWTDTNIFGTNGTIIDWIEENEQLYDAMKANPDHIIMQNKESYGDPSSYSLMKGLYMAKLIGGWGVATDWWHWQVSGFKSLFNSNNSLIDSEWERIYYYPEALQSQSLMMVASSGGFAFKNEAQFYSVAVNGARTATFEYAVLPFLDRVINGNFQLPGHEDVLRETDFAFLGGEHYKPVNYNLKESTLYPVTPAFGIIPLLPSNLRSEEREIFTGAGIDLIDRAVSRKELEPYKKTGLRGDSFGAVSADQVYYLNPVENRNIRKTLTIEEFRLSAARSLEITTGPHSYMMLKEYPDSLLIHLNNYRVDKDEMIAALEGDESPADALYDWITVDASGELRGASDGTLRESRLVLHTEEGFIPEIRFLEESGSRPYEYDLLTEEETGQLTLVIRHNGAVDLSLSTPRGDESTEQKPSAAPLPEAAPSSQGGDMSELALLIEHSRELGVSPQNVTETSYHNFIRALSAGERALLEGGRSDAELTALIRDIQEGSALLLDIRDAVKELKMYTGTGEGEAREAYLNSYDRLMREILSPAPWYEGKDEDLRLKKRGKRERYDRRLFELKNRLIKEALETLRLNRVALEP